MIYHCDKPTNISIPKKDTDLRSCLQLLAMRYPATTFDIKSELGWTVKKASTNLTVLQAKGFIEALSKGRGIPGGSTWSLTAFGKEVLINAGIEVKEN